MNPNEIPGYVLDSFALLCWLNDEDGAECVEELLEKSKNGKIRLFRILKK